MPVIGIKIKNDIDLKELEDIGYVLEVNNDIEEYHQHFNNFDIYIDVESRQIREMRDSMIYYLPKDIIHIKNLKENEMIEDMII